MLQLPTFSPSTSTLEYVLLYVLVVTTFSGAGLVAIWAGLGKGHWFFRVLVVLAMIATPLIIPIHGLVVQLALQSALTILPLFILRRVRRRNVPAGQEEPGPPTIGRAQLSLRDLLLMTVIVAGLSAILAQVPREVWSTVVPLVLGSMLLVVMTLGGAWIGLRRGRLWLRLVLFALLIPVGVFAMYHAPFWLRLVVLNVFFPMVVIATFLGLVRTASGLDGEATRSLWIRRVAGVSVVLLSLLILFPPAYAGYRLSVRRPIPKAPSLAEPNGYSELVQAWQPLARVMLPGPSSSPKSLIRSFVIEHGRTLDAVHVALQKPCRVSLRYEASDMSDSMSNDLQAHHVAFAFDLEATMAHLEGRDDDAIRILLDQFRLSNAISRGGFLSDTMRGWMFEDLAICRIAEFRGSFSADQCRTLTETLQKIQAESEPLEEVLARDAAWSDRVYPWDLRLGMLLSPSVPTVDSRRTRLQAKRQLLLGELALYAYRQEQGKLPKELADLLPQYLPTVPQDPFSGSPLVYRCTSKGYLLYSIGHNGEDDGGQPEIPKPGLPMRTWGGDLLLDEPMADKSNGGSPASEKGKSTQP